MTQTNELPERSEEDRHSLGLTREEVQAEFEADRGSDTLGEEFMDGELWPTAGLSDKEIELLTEKLRKVRDTNRKRRAGRLGLR